MTPVRGVVLARTGGTYRVQTDAGEVEAVLRGKVKRADDDKIVAGDVVEIERHGSGPATIAGREPRRSVLTRREVGARRAQPIAANADQVIAILAARDPEPNVRMLDRLLVIAEANSLPPVVVVNKADLAPEAVGAVERRYAPAGYRVIATSAKSGLGLPVLLDLLRGRVSILTGESGVGKSTLLNALQPGLNLRTGEISSHWGTGRHTTTAALLMPLAVGGFVVDTPGLREAGTWGIEPDQLARCFPEFRPYLDQCRFDNCRHLAEPHCAVRAAAAAGGFDPDRLESYARIHEEVSVPSWSSGRRRGR
jgi:ribosome biogenesis GTPase